MKVRFSREIFPHFSGRLKSKTTLKEGDSNLIGSYSTGHNNKIGNLTFLLLTCHFVILLNLLLCIISN